MPWRCFMVTPSPFCRRALRRFSMGAKCGEGRRCHDATVVIDAQYEAPGDVEGRFVPDAFMGDPRWPKACGCGYEFDWMADQSQVVVDRLYQGAAGGKLYALMDLDLPVGAMWDAPWMGEDLGWRGPDGRTLVVRMPSGSDFVVDGPAADDKDAVRRGGSWARTGTPPVITVTPSINEVGSYHGHIRDGVVTEDTEGRTFPGLERTA